MIMRIIISGAPRTKKNHGGIVMVGGKNVPRRPVLLPSKEWRAWAKAAELIVNGEKLGLKLHNALLSCDVNCKATFYRDRAIGDAAGYYQGVADLLEDRKVVADDRQIVSWDGSRLEVDRTTPRTVIELQTVDSSQGGFLMFAEDAEELKRLARS